MIPEREKIIKTLHYSIEMESLDDADEMFIIAKNRLLDVNNWHNIIASDSNNFALFDLHYHELHRKAHKGDYIKVKLPAGTSEDKWMHIEAIEYHDYPDDNLEGITINLRPSELPTNNSIPDDSAACLIIERHGIKLTAYYRNENLNIIIDWNELLRGFLKTEDD